MQRLVRIQGLPRLTPRTLVSRQALAAEPEQARRQGFALDNEENELDGRCIGAPIAGPGGRIAAALSISASVFLMGMARAETLAGELTDACRAISCALIPRA